VSFFIRMIFIVLFFSSSFALADEQENSENRNSMDKSVSIESIASTTAIDKLSSSQDREHPHMPIQIIYLNGPSSSGKSSLAKALQAVLDPPFLHIGIDKIIGMMPEKVNHWSGGPASLGYSWKESTDPYGNHTQELQAGPFAMDVFEAYREIVVLLAKRGFHLIIDDVAFGKEEVDYWREVLKPFSVLYVGVKASVETLELREKQRGDRMLGSARAQFYQVHIGNHYDVELDTSVLSVEECTGLLMSQIRQR